MYAGREYDRVQFTGLMEDGVMNPPIVVPAFGLLDAGIPALSRDEVQLLTALIILRKHNQED